MKRTRYSDEQIARILRDAEQSSIVEAAKANGVSEASIYAWRSRFSSINHQEVKRLKIVESENSRLKKILAERDLEIEVMKEIAEKKW